MQCLKMSRFITVLTVLVCAGYAISWDWSGEGGHKAKDGQFPYQISLRLNGSHICGGSIINNHWILTSAYCVNGTSTVGLTIVAGTNTLNSEGVSYPVKRVIHHDDFDYTLFHNDIALLKVNGEISFTPKIQPVAMNSEEIGGGQNLILSGWGSLHNTERSNNLQYIEVKSVAVNECERIHAATYVDGTQICTYSQKGEGICYGDPGSPLIFNKKLAGIASAQHHCGSNYTDVFLRVSEYSEWINFNMQS